MIIMDKFEKRLSKLSTTTNSALVIGSAFGILEKILPVYNTVFVISETRPLIKSKNLVYKENIDNINLITEVGAIFFDLATIDQLASLKEFWRAQQSVIFIEGADPIGRDMSKSLYETGWRCIDLQELYHVWKQTV